MSDPAATVTERSPDLILARLHLRLGSLSLARAELETLAGKDMLDADGVLDLAEVRWRTGDITGAGEAAALVLDDDEGPVLALVIASEAAAARGRPTEARRLASKALATAANGSIDAIFAGMPRSPAWPPDPAAPPPSPTTMFDGPHPGRGSGRSTPPAGRGAAIAGIADPADVEPVPSQGSDAEPGAGLWDADLAAAAEAEAFSAAAVDATLPTGDEALEIGRFALDAGDLSGAALQLALVLRIAPALAPAVIDLVGDRHEPALAFVRGDAYRLVGRELDARRAYADATRSSSEPEPDPPAEGDPA